MKFLNNLLTSNMNLNKTDPRFRKIFLINILIIISSAILGFYIIFNLLVTKLYPLAALEVIALLSTFLAFYLLRHHHKIELSGSIMIWMVFILTLFFISDRQNQDYAIMQALFLPMIAILLKGKRIGLIYAGIYIVLILAIAYTGIDRWEAAPFTLTSFVNVTVTFAFLVALIYYYELSRQEAYEELDTYKNNLIDKVSSTLQEKHAHEQMLIQQSKMAAMGEMLAAITHQWKQPLSIIPTIILQIKMDLNTSDAHYQSTQEHLENILKQIEYMTQTSKDFASFFKPSLKDEQINLLNSVDDVLLLLDNQLHAHAIAVDIDFKESNPSILGKRNEFLQVLLNIVGNAKDAIVTQVEAGKLAEGEGKITIHCKSEKGRVYLGIEDNGGGIPEGLFEKIFQPYFSTKHKRQGSGIGLYMSKMIIEEKMRGSLQVTNTETGAHFGFVF